MLQRQSELLAFMGAFRTLAIIALGCIALVLLLKRVRAAAPARGALRTQGDKEEGVRGGGTGEGGWVLEGSEGQKNYHADAQKTENSNHYPKAPSNPNLIRLFRFYPRAGVLVRA